MEVTRRKAAVAVAAVILTVTLLYIEHPAVRSLKYIASVMGMIDSEYTLVGMTDVRSIDHVRGNRDAETVLIEYSDFGCVLCAAMQDNFEKIVREKNIMLVSRHLYLNRESPFFERAVAAECIAEHAGEDAYFAFSRYLYDNQHSIDNGTDLAERAVTFGVLSRDMQDCMRNNRKVRGRIGKDSDEGFRLGARGTPYIIVLHGGKPVGISYANEYGKFVERIGMLIAGAGR